MAMSFSFVVTSVWSLVEIIKVYREPWAATPVITSITMRGMSMFTILASQSVTHHHFTYILLPDMSHLINIL